MCDTAPLSTSRPLCKRVRCSSFPLSLASGFPDAGLNYEASILSPEAVVPDPICCGVGLKVLIEQMRDQIQNIG